MKLHNFSPIRIEFNSVNGYMFNILDIELDSKTRSFEGMLFGVEVATNYFAISLLFYKFELIK